jgi:tRNA-specific 2-thiouridylase
MGSTLQKMDRELFEHYLSDECRRGPVVEGAFTGAAGGAACGDLSRISFTVADGQLENVTFDAEGCGATKAATAAVAETIDGGPVLDAALLDIDTVDAAIGGLTPAKRHAAQLATDALHRALQGVASSHLNLVAPQGGGGPTSPSNDGRHVPARDGCHAPQRNPRRVAVAMSGGVDSAVAAARAAESGHDVTGIHLALSRNPKSYRTGARGCCTIEDSNDARRAADVIGIPFYVWDMSDRFHEDVVEDFVAEYAAGRTPNPCLRCNEKIKFAAVLDRALALGFDAVATGHYARLVTAEDGTVEMHRAVDHGKDQSYVLGVLTQQQLAHSLFPLGGSNKSEVRAEAERRGLSVARKPDSHDICFISDGDTSGWLHDKLGDGSGEFVDHATGEVLGHHDGAFGFTIGQRKGLRIGRPADDGRPRYVLDIEPVSGTVTVGPREELTVDRVDGHAARWCGPAPTAPVRGTVQLRAHGDEHRAVVTVDGSAVRIELLEPAQGIAAGQAAVVYDGARVVGSCTITAARRATATA